MADSASPIFVLAAPFSGSSWLAGVLGQHAQLFACPQLFAFAAETVGELLDLFALSQADHGDGLRRTVAELCFGGQSDQAITEADHWLRARSTLSIKALLDALAAAAAPRRMLIPDCESALRPMELRRLQQAYPNARVIHLIRHPFAQGVRLASWLQARLFVPIDYRDYGQVPAAAEPQIPWLRANHNLDRLAASGMALRRISSEGLDSHFSHHITGLCEWLGLDTSARSMSALEHPERWPFAQRGPTTAQGGLEAEVWDVFPDDVEALAAAPRLVGPLPWRRDGAGFDAAVVTLAQAYGYR